MRIVRKALAALASLAPGAAGKPLISVLRSGVRLVLWVCYLAVASSFLSFALIEIHPAILELVNLQRVPYYAIKGTYITDDKLVFRRRTRVYPSPPTASVYGGDQFHEVPAAHQSQIKQFTYHRQLETPEGFRHNSSSAPYEIIVVGDSFMEIGETERNTFAELLKVQTQASVMNLGQRWYGPYQYLEVIKRYAAAHKPRAIVVGLFTGNDMHDLNEYERWLRTGAYHTFGGDQTRSFLFRYYAAMRDVVRVVLSDIRSALLRRQSAEPGSDDLSKYDLSKLHEPLYARSWHPRFGFMQIGGREMPIVFSYWNPPRSAAELLQTQQWTSFDRIAASLAGLEKEWNTRVVWLLIPTKAEIYGRQAAHSTRASEGFRKLVAEQQKFDRNFVEAFRAIADRHKLEYLDLLPAFQQMAQDCLVYFPADSHWSVHGRRVAADLVSQLLRSQRGGPAPQLDLTTRADPEHCGQARDYYNLPASGMNAPG